MDVRLICTGDESSSLFVPALNETYHSKNGALTESRHVFWEAGFRHLVQTFAVPAVRALDVGLGTGLNAWITIREKTAHFPHLPLCYHGLEKYPLPADLIGQLNYSLSGPGTSLFHSLHDAPWDMPVDIDSQVKLFKQQVDLLSFSASMHYNLVYFDAFSPDTQPEMWGREVFAYLFHVMSQPAILVTYCAKGIVRRRLQEVGFQVERLPGPPGKREMLRAVKSEAV